MTSRLDEEKVWIVGAKGFDPGEYASSPHGCQARVLDRLGETLTYDDLVCYSAFAFRVGVHDEMCPSAGHPCCGFMCMAGSDRALPWRVKVFESLPWSQPKDNRPAFEAEACAAIKTSIDNGIPVHYGGEEDGLIIGYADEGRRWWCLHPYHKGGSEAFWHNEADGFAGGTWPWGIVVWTEPKAGEERVPDRDLTLAALKQAVEMWRTEKREAYFCGEAAYAHWLKWLRGVEGGQVGNPKDGMQGNGWCYDVLAHSRRIAGRWLQHKAQCSDGKARDQLLIAASRYTQLAESLTAGVGCPWDVALPPNRHEDWTSALRQDQSRRLEAARQLDREAIAAIEEALAAVPEAPDGQISQRGAR